MTFSPSLTYLIVLIFGLILGSFFNVLIHRIPKSIQSAKKESLFSAISFPKSYCPKCKKSLLIHHNLPIISWLFLLGKCYFCKAKISIRYPLVEFLSAFIFLFCFWQYGVTTEFFLWLIFFSILLILFFIDLETFFLPDCLTIPLMLAGILKSLLYPFPIDPINAIVGGLVGFFALFITNAIYKFWRKVDGFGFGDFKLLAGLGVWFGAAFIIPIIVLGALIALSMVGLLCLVGRKLNLQMMIPFGPALITATIIIYLNPDILLLI
jgi:leader peptidase (prepilin peptidase) / N-methyltransferase